ncbi:MAG TPA: DUF1552 domain-containing protein [Polyangia bacterium]
MNALKLSRRALSRRTVLRGAGVSLALPWLEAMAPRHAHAQAAGALRFACVYSPNGFMMPKWTPTATGATWTTPPLLTSLEAYKADFNILTGLGNYTASIAQEFGGSHTRATGSLLTQTPIGSVTMGRLGISLDQVIAAKVGTMTKFPSIQIGTRASSLTGACEDRYSCAYNNNISWSGPTTPLTKQVDPRDVFNRLFADGTKPPTTTMPGGPVAPADNRAFFGKSILDVVRQRATDLSKRLGKSDRDKLEEYTTAVREVEARLERVANMSVPGTGGTNPPAAMCTPGTPPKTIQGTTLPFNEHLDLLSDMLALAFQCDVTRIATYMFEHSFSEVRSFSFLPGVTSSHHALTHSNKPDQEEKICRFYIERFGYLLGKLKGMKEGDRTVLDNSIIYFTSEFGDAHLHDHRKLPMLVAGKAAGKWKTGLHVNYPPDPNPGTGVDGRGNPKDTQLAHLHLTTLRAFGMPNPTFGVDEKGAPMADRTLPDFVI